MRFLVLLSFFMFIAGCNQNEKESLREQTLKKLDEETQRLDEHIKEIKNASGEELEDAKKDLEYTLRELQKERQKLISEADKLRKASSEELEKARKEAEKEYQKWLRDKKKE